MITDKLEQKLRKIAKNMKTLQFAMHVPDLGIKYSFSNTEIDQRFHSASVGKWMTSTLTFMAIEKGFISLNSKAQAVLKPGVLDGLFVVNGIDHQSEITIKHLLSHTSGVNDYFEGKTIDGSRFIDVVLRNKEAFWTPMDLIGYTRIHQKAVDIPGKTFFYSDTGYVLLGLILEAVYDMEFHEALDKYVFKPAEMTQTALCFYGKNFDQTALAPLFLRGVDVHLYNSLSCDFSGGGLSTTAEDLLKFIDCFAKYEFISQRSIDQMAVFNHRFHQGLYYGVGMMQVHFEEFFFLLKNLPRLQGHLGISGVHAWYDPITKASFVLNVGNTKDMAKSFRLLIAIIQTVYK